MSAEAARVRELAVDVADDVGVDVLDVAVKGSGPRRLVRVVVDRKGGVDLALCQRVSQQLSQVLDEEDPVEGRYSLEVTSPGTDWPLEDRAAFDRVEGRDVLVHWARPDESVEQIRGRVLGAGEDEVELEVDGTSVRVPYTEIVKAKQALPW